MSATGQICQLPRDHQGTKVADLSLVWGLRVPIAAITVPTAYIPTAVLPQERFSWTSLVLALMRAERLFSYFHYRPVNPGTLAEGAPTSNIQCYCRNSEKSAGNRGV
jgi:hypothetical protein